MEACNSASWNVRGRCSSKNYFFYSFRSKRLTAASTLGFLALGALGFFSFVLTCKSVTIRTVVSMLSSGNQIGHSYVYSTFLVVAFLTAGFFVAGFLAAFLSSSLSL